MFLYIYGISTTMVVSHPPWYESVVSTNDRLFCIQLAISVLEMG